MSDTEIRMMRYTIEQLSAELQATRQYVSDIKTELERTRKALDVAIQYIKHTQIVEPFWFNSLANKTLDEIETALKQKE